jgi:hypothetical protein
MTVEEDWASVNELPFLPMFPAAQVIRARAHYVETPSVSGVAFVTVFRQDAFPFVADEFLYTFQGVSTDGSTYIAALFPVEASVFPAELPSDFSYEEWSEAIPAYMNESIARLNEAAPADFTPSLDQLDQLLNSLTVGDPQAAM